MKIVKIVFLSVMGAFFLFSCTSASKERNASVRGDILLAVKEDGKTRSGDPQLQMAGMNAATLYIPTPFKVSAQGEVSFSASAGVSGFQMTGGEGPVVGNVKIAQYAIEFNAVISPWKGQIQTVSLPSARLLQRPTENLVMAALLQSGLKKGTFVLRSVSYSQLTKSGKAVVEVGP